MSGTRLSGGSQHARSICALPCQGMCAITLKLVQELLLGSVCSRDVLPWDFLLLRHNLAELSSPPGLGTCFPRFVPATFGTQCEALSWEF